ncbi:MAG TPA: alcohol dehydrogenase catalytic domain-containing protein, partial [Thermoanaerobaculia bacterium]|nr:alcohol dehydrogenase catalytic domain-containing protein [Thermoanaerobaculia bacterium]
MRALRYHGPRTPLRLETVPTPEPGEGELRLRVTAAGICHTELHFLSGLLNLGISPLTLGHETVGVVDAVGAGVTGFRGGERVIAYYYAGCGACEHCRRGDENLCNALRAEYGFITDGGFAEFMIVPARNAILLPPQISDEAAAPIGCGVTTAIHASKLARLAERDTVLVYGAGTVGFGLIQLAKLSGAQPIAVGRSPEKLKLARDLGAQTIDASTEEVAARVREMTGGRGADVVFELVATRATMDQSMRALSKRGRLVFIGYSEDSFSVHPIHLLISEVSVTGSVGNTLAE